MFDVEHYTVFIGNQVRFKDTSEIRKQFPWYFANNYHHYIYNCKDVYRGAGYILAHLYIEEKIKGKSGTIAIDTDWAAKCRFNLKAAVLEPLHSSNKLFSNRLIRFKEET